MQQLAALLLRLVGTPLVVLPLAGLALRAIEPALGITVSVQPTKAMVGTIFYIVLGAVMVALSKPLGKWFGRGLE
jgi:hypothetical protein